LRRLRDGEPRGPWEPVEQLNVARSLKVGQVPSALLQRLSMREPQAPIRSKRKRHRFVRVAIGLGMLAVVFVLALPVWLPWLLTPSLRMAGVEVAAYDRVGYSRFALRDVQFANENLTLTADRIETLQPVLWVARLAGFTGVARSGFGEKRPARMPIEVDGWRLELPLAGPPATEPGMTSMTEALDLAGLALDRASWLRPGLDLRRGLIRYQDEILAVPRVVGGLDRIEIELGWERLEQPLRIQVGWSGDALKGTRLTLAAETALGNEPLSSRTAFAQAPGQSGWTLGGTGIWGGNEWRYEGEFGLDNWWPAELTLDAAGWRVALAPWNIPGYTSLEGGVRLSWVNETLEYVTAWQATPKQEAQPPVGWPDGPAIVFPPVSVDLAGELSLPRIRLDRLSVETPGLTLGLDDPIEVDLETLRPMQPGRIAFAVRLEDLGLPEDFLATWLAGLLVEPDPTPLQGTLSGMLEISPNPDGWPLAVLSLSSSGFGWSHWHADALELKAELDWPEGRLSGFQLDLGDGSTLRAEGRVQFPERRLEAIGLRLELASGLARPFLPESIGFERIVLNIKGEGEVTPALDRLLSHGQLEITKLSLPSVQPLEPVRIGWKPAVTPVEPGSRSEHHWQVELQAGESKMNLEGGLRFALDEGWIDVPLHSFQWQPGVNPGEPALPTVRLAAPVTLGLRQSRAVGKSTESGWHVMLPETAVRAVTGTDGAAIEPEERSEDRPSVLVSADVSWPQQGVLELGLEQWNARWLRDWLVLPALEEKTASLVWGAGLDRLRLVAGWDGGPLEYTVEAAAHVPHPLLLGTDTTDRLRVMARLTGDDERATLDTLRVEDSGGVWLEAAGRLSLVVVPGDTAQPIHWQPGQPLEFVGRSDRHEDFSVSVPQLGEVSLQGLSARIELGGSLLEPKGELRVELDRLAVHPDVDSETAERPAITELQVGLTWSPEAVELDALHLTVAGQAIQLAGTLPLADGFWTGLPETIGQVDLAASHGRIQLGPIQLDAFQPLLPAPLRAQGELEVDAHWAAGLEISGALEFHGLATHPLPTSGAVQEIQGRVELEGSSVRLTEISAMLGGRRIGMDGWLDLEPTLQAIAQERPASAQALMALPLPLWDIALTADRLPVVRRPGMVIRTGLDIRTTHDGTSTPLIAGRVTPQESVFITDVRTLLPRGPATPMPRPPFVRIDHPLVGDWRLKIQVQGDEFLRVRSPVFRGVISVGMTVGGHLREPVLVGDVMIADGQVQFPFGNLRVTQGLVSLSEVDPTTLMLLVNASSRVYGYQINMNVSGTAESPAVVFSANPPLASESILLMLTAGQLPQDELTFTAQQRATALASYLGKTLIDSWALEEPGEERLSIRSGESISVGGRATYHAEYRLSDRWSLIGEYDEYDDMNAGVKYRLLYR
jgi:translocation and assembly module TamB